MSTPEMQTSNREEVLIVECDEDVYNNYPSIDTDLTITGSLKKLQLDMDLIKSTLKTVVKMLHKISVSKKEEVVEIYKPDMFSDIQIKSLIEPEPEIFEPMETVDPENMKKEDVFPITSGANVRIIEDRISDDADFCEYFQMLLLKSKDLNNKEEALKTIISEEALKDFNWNGEKNKRPINVNFFFSTIYKAWQTDDFGWTEWKAFIENICKPEANEDDGLNSILDEHVFNFPIVDKEELDEFETRLACDKKYEMDVKSYVKCLATTLGRQQIKEKIIADHVLEEIETSNSLLLNIINDHTKQAKNMTDRKNVVESGSKSQAPLHINAITSAINKISHISQLIHFNERETSMFPLNDVESLDKLKTTIKSDANALTKLRADFFSTRTQCEVSRVKNFRLYFGENLLKQFNWNGRQGSRAAKDEPIFQILFESWKSNSFTSFDFEQFVKKELKLLRVRKHVKRRRDELKSAKL